MWENRTELIGFLGSNPESEPTKSGHKLATFSLATKTLWTDENEQRHEKTEWHRIIVFRDALADFVTENLKKGDHVYVIETLVSNTYEREVGKGKTKNKVQILAWQIKAYTIRKLDRKQPEEEVSPTETQSEQAPH
ncbi:MAG TPA: single-stranded DNA-binding protein, partial [Candidatus Acidoferrales bacterium]|nr:single-stranded DNA-binding protein [Candidatus Acidoferrales bacterium]